MAKIFGFSGKLGSGKNYLAEIYLFELLRKQNKNVAIMAFGDYLKMLCILKDGISYERLFHEKDNESRTILQKGGMEERKTNNNIFIRAIDCNIRLAIDRKVDAIIITDVRFNIELEYLKEKGAVLFRVNATNRNLTKLKQEGNNSECASHISETELDNCDKFDYYINNDYGHEKEVEEFFIKKFN